MMAPDNSIFTPVPNRRKTKKKHRDDSEGRRPVLYRVRIGRNIRPILIKDIHIEELPAK